MFDIGWSELLLLGVLAILVVGPKDLPRMMRTIGQYTAKIKAAAREFQRSFDEMARESELDELRQQIADAKASNPLAQVKEAMSHPLDVVGRALKEPEAPKPDLPTTTKTGEIAVDDAPPPVTGPENSIGAGAASAPKAVESSVEPAPKDAAQ
ncbi:MAG: Sec-independent protein translocase protein TatB [Parvibaculum sp.]